MVDQAQTSATVHRPATSETPELGSQKLFTPLEAWEYSGKRIGRDTLYGLLHSGHLKSIRVGRRFVIPRSSLEAFLEGK